MVEGHVRFNVDAQFVSEKDDDVLQEGTQRIDEEQ